MLYRSPNAHDSVDRTLLWTVLARFGVPAKMFAVVRQLHDDMRACVRLDACECLDMFDVEQGLRKGGVPARFLFNMFFTAALIVAEKCFIADAAIMDIIAQLQRTEKGKKKRGKARAEKVDELGGKKRRLVRCGECCKLTMRALYRGHQEGWRG